MGTDPSPSLEAVLLQASLLALVASFAHYVPVLAWARWAGSGLPTVYAQYASLLDLFLETLWASGP